MPVYFSIRLYNYLADLLFNGEKEFQSWEGQIVYICTYMYNGT